MCATSCSWQKAIKSFNESEWPSVSDVIASFVYTVAHVLFRRRFYNQQLVYWRFYMKNALRRLLLACTWVSLIGYKSRYQRRWGQSWVLLRLAMRFSDDVLQRELTEIHLPVISEACSNLLTSGVWLEVVWGVLVLVLDHRNPTPSQYRQRSEIHLAFSPCKEMGFFRH